MATTGYAGAVWEQSDPAESSSGTEYQYGADANGRLGCQCRGWTTKKPSQIRNCKHTKRFITQHRLTVDERGDYQYVIASRDSSYRGTFVAANGAVSTPISRATPPVKVPSWTAQDDDDRDPADIDDGQNISKVSAGRKRFKTIAMPTNNINLYVEPMLASPFPEGQTLENFIATVSDGQWAVEEKYDGERKIVGVFADGTVKSWSRPGSKKGGGKKDPIEFELPAHIKAVFAKFPWGSYDGEIYIPGGISSHVRKGTEAGNERFVVFDVVTLLGQSTIAHSYDVRRSLLAEIFERDFAKQTNVTLAESVKPSLKFVKAIFARKPKPGEGVILKRRAATYQPGVRSRDFIKVKSGSGAPAGSCLMVITGYKKGELGPRSVILLRNPLDGSTTKVASMSGTMALVKDIHDNGDKYIGRECRIEYQFRTDAGSYRHPRWDRWENE